MHIGTPRECMSCYCRGHTCGPPLINVSEAPSIREYLLWFEEGLALPGGKDGKSAHLVLFTKMRRASEARANAARASASASSSGAAGP